MVKLHTNVVVAGAKGKMGREAVEMILAHPSLHLVAGVDSKLEGEVVDLADKSILFYNNLEKALKENRVDVLLDLTNPEVVYQNVMTALENGVKCVVGTSGLSGEKLEEIKKKSEEIKTGVLIVPNFSIGAILMMKFAEIAVHYYEYADIIEKHNHLKKDAPSGTAVRTAERLREQKMDICLDIHSVRMPGLVAHQEVSFGGAGEILTVKHDSLNRESFMPGVAKAIESVMEINHFEMGLDRFILKNY